MIEKTYFIYQQSVASKGRGERSPEKSGIYYLTSFEIFLNVSVPE